MLAGTGGDCGKTLAAIGLAAAWRREGTTVMPFKKGPDYIDSAWLTLAAGRPARNLDTWMMGAEKALCSFTRYADEDGINLIEGNRGLHDGEDARGTHSSAALAKLLGTPVVLLIPTIKVTRTSAAIVLGLKMLDPDVNIAGVILNSVATSRQESIIRRAIGDETGLPVIGAIPRLREDPLPGRHLGLITPSEHDTAVRAVELAADLVAKSVDMPNLIEIARSAKSIHYDDHSELIVSDRSGEGIRIGFFKSSAFTFYYPENLELLESFGIDLIPIDPIEYSTLPDLDGLYIGGGFPETHVAMLSGNSSFLRSVADAAGRDLPIWAECGGLMFLSRSIRWKDRNYPMAGVYPVDVVLTERPQGHGYQEVVVDTPNPFIETGTILRGHEFHYSRADLEPGITTIFDVKRGVGLGQKRDGMLMKNALACYLHLHSAGTPQWAHGLLKAAVNYHDNRNKLVE